MRINEKIYYRYEKNIGDGILYVYNFETELLIKSKEFTYQVLKIVDENEDCEENFILQKLQNIYINTTIEEISKALEKVMSFLYSKKVII